MTGHAPDDALFGRPVDVVARSLIGALLTVDGAGGRIVETEAYDAGDPASHSFRGPTSRNAAMFGPVGHAYVYRIYGLHWCLNLVCGDAPGGAVLIRALEPVSGLDVMRARRGMEASSALCSGPARLCQALGVDDRLNHLSMLRTPFTLTAPAAPVPVVRGARIGISRAVDLPRRWGEAGSAWLSRPFATC
ncbi:DNA-3-methyladenine glycosylase [Brevundimonas sp.]|jgi:DNA-3-methyladenine glycosylase|uniref:DNA-3-methyladenine glycosylase n=1 Tax=Brevundimonas sp. TaxID=1871086 RepID=UPI002E144206|nr:DNA-3-methyladenine glycosylase [Brevundimonas sp.]